MSRWKPHHGRMRRWKSRRVLILVAWLGLVAVGAAPGAYSDDSPGSGYDLPPAGTGAAQGPVGISQTALARRAKLIVRLPNMLGWVQVSPPRDPNSGPGRSRPVPLPDEFQSHVPGCVATGVPIMSDVYAIGPAPEGRPVGELPPATIKTVAFGSIPVTATLQLSQIVDGQLEPLRADLWQTPRPGYGYRCDPNNGNQTPTGYGTVKGQLSLTISRLRIDGQPVDIGAHCRTVTPLEINLWADRAGETARPSDAGPDWAMGWTPGTGGDLYQRKDTTRVDVPGGYLVHPGSTDLTIPAFTDCTSTAGDDISRLLTATISGSGNHLTAFQPEPGLSSNSDEARNDPTLCYAANNMPGKPVMCPLDPPPPPTIPIPKD